MRTGTVSYDSCSGTVSRYSHGRISTPIANLSLLLLFGSLPFLSYVPFPSVARVSLFRMAVVISSMMWLSFAAMNTDRVHVPIPTLICAFVFGTSALIVTALRADGGSSIALWGLFRVVALYVLISAMISSAKPRYLVLRAAQKTYCYAVLPLALASLSLAFGGVTRPMPLGSDPNYAGYLMVAALPMSERWNGWGWAAYRLVLILGVLSTGSRTALVTLTAWALCVGWTQLVNSHSVQHRLVGSGVVIICIAAVAWKFPDLISTLTKSQFPAVSDISSRILRALHDPRQEARWVLWEKGLRAFTDRPILGVGLGHLGLVYSDLGLNSAVSHSMPITMLGEMGISGLIACVVLWWTSFPRDRCDCNWIMLKLWVITIINSMLTGSTLDRGMWMMMALTTQTRSLCAERGDCRR